MKRKEYLQKKKRREILHRREKKAHHELWKSFNLDDRKGVMRAYKIMEPILWELDLLRKELRPKEEYM